MTAAFYTALLCRVMAIGLVMESAVETTERLWEVEWRGNGAHVSSELYGGKGSAHTQAPVWPPALQKTL